jgi:hypothetical protein
MSLSESPALSSLRISLAFSILVLLIGSFLPLSFLS